MSKVKIEVGELVKDLKGIPIIQVLFAVLILILMETIQSFLEGYLALMWQFLFGVVIITSIALLIQRMRNSLFFDLKDVFKNKERKIDIDEVKVPVLREDMRGIIEFRGVYSKLLDILDEMEVTPVLRMEPPLFKGNCLDPKGREIWRGKAISLADEAMLRERLGDESTYRRQNKGKIEFSFEDIREEYLNLRVQNVELLLELYLGNFDGKDKIDSGEPKYALRLADCRFDILDNLEIVHLLIESDYVKRLPPKHNPLYITKIGENTYYTNICFIAKKFVSDLNKIEMTGEDSDDRQETTMESRECCTLLNALTRVIFSTLVEHGCLGKSIKVHKPPEPSYAFDLNSRLADEILNKIKERIGLEQPSKIGKVILSTFHTREFEDEVRLNHAQGVCLFGFSVTRETWDIRAIFDFTTEKSHEESIWGKLDARYLSMMKEDRRNVFQDYCLELLEETRIRHSEIERMKDSSEETVGTGNSVPFPETIYKLSPSPQTIYRGKFLTSFPQISDYWIDLSTCNREILSEGKETLLYVTYSSLITKIINSEASLKDLVVFNLCVDETKLSDGTLTVLQDFSFGENPVYSARYTETDWEIYGRKKEERIHQEKRRKAVIISALDSHSKEIRQFVKTVEEKYSIRPLCLISFISLDDPLLESRQRIAVGINRLSIFRLENGKYIPALT